MVPTPRCSCRWAALCAFVLLSCMAHATVYTWNLKDTNFSQGNTTTDNRVWTGSTYVDGITWNFTRTRNNGRIDAAQAKTMSDDYVRFGGGNGNQGESLELTTSSIPNKIVRIEVECYSAVANGHSLSSGHSLSITVNSKSYEIQSDGSGNGSSLELTTLGKAYVATPLPLNQPEGGAIKIEFVSQSGDAYLYVKSVRIYTDESLFFHAQGRWGKPLLENGMQEVHTEKRIIYAPANADIRLGRNNDAFQTYVRWYDFETDKAAAGLKYYDNVATVNPTSQQPDYLYNSFGAISTNQSGSLVSGLCAMYHYSGSGVVRIACDQSAYTDYSIGSKDNGATTTITEPTLSQRIIYEIHPASEMTSRMELCKNSNSWFEEYSMIAPTGNALLLSPQFPMFSPAEQPGYYYNDNGVPTLMTGGIWTLITYRYGGYSSTTLDASNTTAGQWLPVEAHWSVGNVEYMLRWRKSPLDDVYYNIAKWTVSYHNAYGVGPFLMNEPACLVGSTVIAEEHFNSYCAPATTYNRSSAPLPASHSSYGFYCSTQQHVGVNDGVDCPGLMEYSLVNNGRGFNNSPWWYNDGGEYNVFANHIGNAAATDINTGYALYANAMAKPQLVYSMDIPLEKINAVGPLFVSAYVGHVGQTNVTPALDFELVGTDAQGEHLLLTYSTGQLNVNAEPSYDCKMGWRRILFPYEFAASPSSYTKLQLRIISKARTDDVKGFFLDDIAVYAQGEGSTFAHFQHQKGRFRSMMESNLIGHYQQQAVHEERRVIYAKEGDVITLSRRNDAFQQYVRWYDYQTDQMLENLQVSGTQTGTNAKLLSGSHFGILNYTSSNSERITNTTATFTYSGGEVVYVGCDQSAYTDFKETTADGLTTFTEPTLSQRIVYEIHPASEMAEAVSACTTNSGKWLEEYTLFAPPKHSILVGPKYAYTNANGVIPNYYCKQGDNVLALKDGSWTWKENGAQPSRPIYNGQFYYYNDYQTDNDITFELTCTLNGTTYQIARFNVVRTNIQYPTQNRDSACLQNYRMLYCETFNYDSPGSGRHRYSKPLDAMQSELGFFTDNTNCHIGTNVNNNVQSSTNDQGICEYALVNDGSWWDNSGALQTNNYHNFANRYGLKDDGYSGVNGSKGYALNFKENSKQIKVYSLDIPNVYSSSDDIFVSAYLAARSENTNPQLDFEIVGVMADESEIPVATYMTGNITDMWGWYRVLFAFKANDQAGIHHYQLRIVYKGTSVSPSCIFLDDIAVYVPEDADDPQDDPSTQPNPTQVQFNHKIGMYRSGYEQNKVGSYSQQAVHEDWNVVYAPACTLRLSRNDDAFQQYVRWFNYQTDQEMVGLEARAIQTANGSNYLSGAKAGRINCTASAVDRDRIAGSTPCRAIYPYDGKRIVYIGCDQSAYKDFSLQTNSTPAVFTEPTLSQRIVYEIHPASEMADKMDRHKHVKDAKAEHWLEEYDIQASAWSHVYLGPQYAFKTATGKFANYYCNAANPTSMADGVWELVQWDGSQWLNVQTITAINLIEGQYVDYWVGNTECQDLGIRCKIGGNIYNVALFHLCGINPRGPYGVGPAVFSDGEIARISGATILAEEHFGAGKDGLESNAHYSKPLNVAASSYGFFSHEVENAVDRHVRADFKQAASNPENYPGYCEYALVNDGSGWSSSSSSGEGFNSAFANHKGKFTETEASNGYALFVNGSKKPGVVYALDFQAELCLGAVLYMSAYVGELGGSSVPVLDFQVVGVDANGKDTLLTTFTTGEFLRDNQSDASIRWHRVLFPFTYSGNMDYHHFSLRIINKSRPSTQNGIFIDDVAVYLCPSPLQILLPSTVAAGENPVDICKKPSVDPGQNEEETSTEKMVFYLRIDCGQYAEYISGNTMLFYRWTESETQKLVPGDSGSVALPQIDATYYVPPEDTIESFARFDALYRDTKTLVYKFIHEKDIAPIDFTSTERYILYIACPVTGFQKGKEYTCEISNTGNFSDDNASVCSKSVSVKADNGMQIVSDADGYGTACTNHSFNLRLILKYVTLNASGTSSVVHSAQYLAHWLYGTKPADDDTDKENKLAALYGDTYDNVEAAIMQYINAPADLTPVQKQLIESLVRRGLLVMAETLNPADPAYTVIPQPGVSELAYTAFPIRPIAEGVPYCSVPQSIIIPVTQEQNAYAIPVVKDYDESALPNVVASRPRRVRVPFSTSSGARVNEVEVKVKLSHGSVKFHFRDVTFVSATDAQYLENSAANPLVCKPNNSDNNLLTGDNQKLVFSGFGIMKAGHSYTFRLRFYLDPDVQISSECLDNTGRVPDIESQITFIIVPDYLTFKTADAPGKEATAEYQSWQTAAWNNDANWLFNTEDDAASAFAPCASTSVVFRSGDHILKDKVSATDLEPGSQDYIAYDIGFEPYTCRRVHVPAHTAIVGQENIRSTDAWSFDMPIAGGQWNMTAMPLKGIRTGDMFLTSDKGDESDLAPFTAQPISQGVGQPASDRLVYSFYNSLYSEAGLKQVVAEGNPIDIAETDWSLATNALTMRLDGKAWSLGLAAKGNHVMRLPKARPVEYHYFQQGNWVEKAETIEADADYGKPLYTTSPHVFKLSNGFDGDIFIFGNPTFAYIDLVKFYAANSDKISNEFYLSGVGNTDRYKHYTATVNKEANGNYTWTSTDYDALSLPLSRYLPPMTAVMIKRDPSDSKNHSLEGLRLTADMLVTSEGLGKTSNSANAMPAHDDLSRSRDAFDYAISISAQAADAGFISYALLVEDEDAHEEARENEDAEVLMLDAEKTPFAVYTSASKKALAINRTRAELSVAIPLNIYSQVALSSATITFSGNDAYLRGWDLVDRQTKRRTALHNGMTVEWHASQSGAARYFLEHKRFFSPSDSLPDVSDQDWVKTYSQAGQLTVQSLIGLSDLRIYDVSGKLVYATSRPGRSITIPLPAGFYLLYVSDTKRKVLVP